jgi:hypothetical protein
MDVASRHDIRPTPTSIAHIFPTHHRGNKSFIFYETRNHNQRSAKDSMTT